MILDLQLSLRTKDNSKKGLGITCNLADYFYADITTNSNATSSATKDFIISYGKHDDVADTFKIFYSYILRNQVIPVGVSTVTITCQASGAGSYDCMGGIGTYNQQTGEFTLENGLTVLDILYILGSSVTDAYLTTPSGCTNPTGSPGEIICGSAPDGQDPTHKYKCLGDTWADLGYYPDCDVDCTNPNGVGGEIVECGVGYGGQPDPTHKYRCIGGAWVDQGYNPTCELCTNPDGIKDEIVECGVGYGGQPDATHKYQCTNGAWVDLGYNSNCVSPDATIIMENANIPIGGSDTARVLITNVTNLGSVEVHVLYNPNVVSIQAVSGGDFDSMTPYDNGNGDLYVGAYTMGSINGSATLCTITFGPATGASVNDTCSLNLSGTSLLDATPQANPIPHSNINGIATIVA